MSHLFYSGDVKKQKKITQNHFAIEQVFFFCLCKVKPSSHTFNQSPTQFFSYKTKSKNNSNRTEKRKILATAKMHSFFFIRDKEYNPLSWGKNECQVGTKIHVKQKEITLIFFIFFRIG